MGDLCDTAVVTHAFCPLTCRDEMVGSIAVCETTKGRIAPRGGLRAAIQQGPATLVSGLLEGEFGQNDMDFVSLWICAHDATWCPWKLIGCCWLWCNEQLGPKSREPTN